VAGIEIFPGLVVIGRRREGASLVQLDQAFKPAFPGEVAIAGGVACVTVGGIDIYLVLVIVAGLPD
jgi:hypothetical protein